MLKEFIEKTGDINARDAVDHTLLHCACFNPDPGAVSLLLEHGADLNARNRWDETPLHIACRMGHEKAAYLLLVRGASIDPQDKSGRTPLSWACRSGSIDTVNLLLSRGADPEIMDKYGATALDYAAALNDDKTERGRIVGTFLLRGLGVKKLTLDQHHGCDQDGKPEGGGEKLPLIKQ